MGGVFGLTIFFRANIIIYVRSEKLTWGRLSLQVREEFGIFLGIGRKPPYLCIVNKKKDIKFNNLKIIRL